jgi:hypothetical protein
MLGFPAWSASNSRPCTKGDRPASIIVEKLPGEIDKQILVCDLRLCIIGYIFKDILEVLASVSRTLRFRFY